MSSIVTRFQLFDDIDGREITTDDSANTISSNGGLAIPVAIEKELRLSKVWLSCGGIRDIQRKSSLVVPFRRLAVYNF